MKKYLLLLTLYTATSLAQPLPPITPCHYRLGIQGAIATNGAIGIGVVGFSESTEWGLTASGTRNNAHYQSNNATPVLFAGLRYLLQEQTYCAWGIDLAGTFGTINGSHIDANYQAGPYISLEQMITDHFMLAGWILPYQYGYEKLSHSSSVTTHSFFSSGGLAINYLF
jgi:hypothetical protein